MAKNLSTMSGAAAVAVGGNALAALSDRVTRRMTTDLFWRITQHAGADLLPQRLESHAGFDARVFRDAALRRMDRGAAIDRSHRRDLEREINSRSQSLSRFPQTDRGDPDLWLVCGSRAVVWFLSELHADARRLLCRRHGPCSG